MSYEQDFWKSVRKLQTCKNCQFWMTTLSPEDRAEAARHENTDGVCDMFNEDGFSPNDYCSRWSARPEDVKRAMEAMSSMHEYIEEEARKSREQYAQLTEEEASAFIDMVNREARHGVWEMIPPPKGHRAGAYVKFRCSECGTEYESAGRYCPNCWARMDGKEKTDE